jgi:hypothetical protein
MIRTTAALALAATALTLTACSSAAAKPKSTQSAPPAALTSEQSESICNDLAAWLPGAYNQDMPRFTQALETGETEAVDANSQLGSDLSNLDSNLQSLNGVAFEPSPPNYTGTPTGMAALTADCAQLGVTLPAMSP